jgi:hypothetical protein
VTAPPVLSCIHGVDLLRPGVGCAMLALVMSIKARREKT